MESLNIQPAQQMVVQEILSASKRVTKKQRWYTDNWLLMCMLLYIRNPASYCFIRNNNILPPPSISTIKRYLSLVGLKWGFDKDFFQALKLKMTSKSEYQCHGIVVFDEIQVRKAMTVNSKTMTYEGFENFGDVEVKSKNPILADHALVFLFQPFADSYSLPFGAFAAKGATKGVVLAQLLVQGIMLLEEAGIIVDGICSDGAMTNRKMWSQLGVSGKLSNLKNYFQHPSANDRKIYVFSDVPHLFKCIRNHLLNNKCLELEDGRTVQWSFYEHLFDMDMENAGHLRVCPRLTPAHIHPTNFQKVKVKLATQVFSNSVTNGLEFYAKRCPEKFENVDGTICFTKMIYDTFDVLNRWHPA